MFAISPKEIVRQTDVERFRKDARSHQGNTEAFLNLSRSVSYPIQGIPLNFRGDEFKSAAYLNVEWIPTKTGISCFPTSRAIAPRIVTEDSPCHGQQFFRRASQPQRQKPRINSRQRRD